jgi:hypothetical protein
MPRERKPLRRGEIIDQVVSDKSMSEADYFLQCPACGGWVDIRDLAAVFEHEGPLPHPPGDRPQ